MKIHTKTVYDMSTWEVLEDEWYEYAGPVALAGGGGGSSKTTTNTIAEPPAWQKPYIQNVLSEAENLYQTPGPFYYPGSTVADINPQQAQSFAGALNYADTGAQRLANQAQYGYGMGIQAVNPLQNPFFHSTAKALINPLTQQLTEQVLPQIDAGAVQAGQYGGSRQGIAQGMAIDRYQQNALDALSKFGTNAYGQGLDAMTRTLSMTPTVAQAGMLPSSIYGQVGDALRTYDQQLIDANVNRFNFYQGLPYANLAQYAGLVGNPLGTATTSTAPGPSSGGVAGALGGALTGATLGNAASAGTWLGAGPAAALGPAGWAGLAIGGILGSGII